MDLRRVAGDREKKGAAPCVMMTPLVGVGVGVEWS